MRKLWDYVTKLETKSNEKKTACYTERLSKNQKNLRRLTPNQNRLSNNLIIQPVFFHREIQLYA